MPRYFSSISSSFESCSLAAVAPIAAGALVQQLGERLGQAIGQGLGHDRVVVVVVGLEPLTSSSAPTPAVTAKAPR